MATVVVYVHGLWQTGREAHWLRRRLAAELGGSVEWCFGNRWPAPMSIRVSSMRFISAS